MKTMTEPTDTMTNITTACGTTIERSHTVSPAECAEFLSEYGGTLFKAGCTCIRLEKNVSRIARVLGMTVEVFILPRHLHLTVTDGKGEAPVCTVANISESSADFSRITRLSKMSWDVADGKKTFAEAQQELKEMLAAPAVGNQLLPLEVGAANAAFCRLFGGDASAMALVFAATFVGIALKQLMLRHHADIRLVMMACAFVSSVLASAGTLFGFGGTPDVAVATSVLYLVPGIPLINSFCDMLDGHYICAIGRLTGALVLIASMSVGLCAALALMNIGMF